MTAAPARVLEALRRAGDRPCSGATLSEALGVTRAQVWKHVESLRERGYRIDGAPGGGYRLRGAPDRLFAEELEPRLETRWLGRSLHHFDSTDSTNRVAGELARQGEPHGSAVIAEGQTAGRGRLGRGFHSPPFQNLYLSVVLRPQLTTAEAPTLILAAAVAVAETVAATCEAPEAVAIKWPNDVLLGGRKTCGILVELTAEATRVAHLVLGIGVNLNVDPAHFPEEFRERATSVSAFLGRRVDRVDFCLRLFGTLEDVLDRHAADGFAGIRPRFDAFFHMAGQRVEVTDFGGDTLAGRVDGIDPDGALRVTRDDGAIERVIAGDVTLRPRPGDPGDPRDPVEEAPA